MVLTPEQIADYIHEEFTPYASMNVEEGKKHLAELIERYAQFKVVTEIEELSRVIKDSQVIT